MSAWLLSRSGMKSSAATIRFRMSAMNRSGTNNDFAAVIF